MYNEAFNPADTFSLAELKRSGLRLGDRRTNSLGEFVLSEANGDLVKGNIVIPVDADAADATAYFTVDDVTYNHTNKTFYQAAAGAVVAVDALAGMIFHIDDDSGDVGYTGIIKGNSAGTVAGPITIYLQEALATDISGNTDINIKVFSPHYVEKCPITVLLQPVNGVVYAAVDQSEAPYFWRQVSGIASVLLGDVPANSRMITPGDDTAGQCKEMTTTAADDVRYVGIVISTAPLADKLALVHLANLG